MLVFSMYYQSIQNKQLYAYEYNRNQNRRTDRSDNVNPFRLMCVCVLELLCALYNQWCSDMMIPCCNVGFRVNKDVLGSSDVLA